MGTTGFAQWKKEDQVGPDLEQCRQNAWEQLPNS
jgi:hypothetical protein